MSRAVTMLLVSLLACRTTAAARAQPGTDADHPRQVSSAPASQPVSRDEALWRQIVSQHKRLAERQPGADLYRQAIPRRRTLLERVRLYLTLYPGGPHRDEAVWLELTTLFELAVLRNGTGDELADKVREYQQNPPSEAVRHEAAYWAMLCERLQRQPTAQPTSAPIIESDAASLAAYHEYVERYPGIVGIHARCLWRRIERPRAVVQILRYLELVESVESR